MNNLLETKFWSKNKLHTFKQEKYKQYRINYHDLEHMLPTKTMRDTIFTFAKRSNYVVSGILPFLGFVHVCSAQVMSVMPYYPSQFSILTPVGVNDFGNWTVYSASKTSSCWAYANGAPESFPEQESINASFSTVNFNSQNSSERSVVLRMHNFQLHSSAMHPWDILDNPIAHPISGVTIKIIRRSYKKSGVFGVKDASTWIKLQSGIPNTSTNRNNSNPFSSSQYESVTYGGMHDLWGLKAVDIGGEFPYEGGFINLRLYFDDYNAPSIAEIACVQLYVHFYLQPASPTTSSPSSNTPSSIPSFSSTTSAPNFSSTTSMPSFSSATSVPSSLPTSVPSFSSSSFYPSSITQIMDSTSQPTSNPSLSPSSSPPISTNSVINSPSNNNNNDISIANVESTATFSSTPFSSNGTSAVEMMTMNEQSPNIFNNLEQGQNSSDGVSIALIAALCSTGLFCLVFCITTGVLLCIYQSKRKRKRIYSVEDEERMQQQSSGFSKFANGIFDKMEQLGGRADPNFDSSESFGVDDGEKIKLTRTDQISHPTTKHNSSSSPSLHYTPVSSVPTSQLNYVQPPPPLTATGLITFQRTSDTYQPLPQNNLTKDAMNTTPVSVGVKTPSPPIANNAIYNSVSQISLFSGRTAGDSQENYDHVNLSEKPRQSLILSSSVSRQHEPMHLDPPVPPSLPPLPLHLQQTATLSSPPPVPATFPAAMITHQEEEDKEKNYYSTTDIVPQSRARRSSSSVNRGAGGGGKHAKKNHYDGLNNKL
jgi:hypothetical protein